MDNSLYQEPDGSVVILGPMQGNIRSYHSSGLSSKEEYLERKRQAAAYIESTRSVFMPQSGCAKKEFRL